jgi:hypothetical protein
MTAMKSVRCYICGRQSNYLSFAEYNICHECKDSYFKKLRQSDMIVDEIKAATVIAHNENIPIVYALNVSIGRYSIAEAKRRIKLKQREKRGKSVDLYDLGRRQPGSYGGSKRK